MSDKNSDPPVADVPDPDDVKKSSDEGKQDNDPSQASSSNEKKHSDDEQALDDLIKLFKEVRQRGGITNNFFIYGNTINDSAIGSNPYVNNSGNNNVGVGTGGQAQPKEHISENNDVNWGNWLREKKIQDQAFVIALLFFPGNTPNFVVNMANELVLLLGEKAVETIERPSIFNKGVSVESIIREGLASIEHQSIHTEAGKLEFESISITNNTALFGIKKLILRDYDLVSLRSVIRQWLIRIIKFDDKKIEKIGSVIPDIPRLQAGLGIGLLIRSELDALTSSIRPWATSENPNDRLMVGWILLGYFEEDSQDSYWTNVSSLLRHWSSLDNYYYRWTAIASTTRLALISSPEDDEALMLCMSIYKDVCKSGQVNLFTGKFRGVLLKSLKFVFQLSAYHARTVILELASWLDNEQNSNIKDLAAELFVEILNVGITVSEDVSHSSVISIWELCEMENYTVTDSICKLLDQVLQHQKGSYVDYSVKQISKSVSKSLEKEIIPNKTLGNIVAFLRDGRATNRYLIPLFGDYVK